VPSRGWLPGHVAYQLMRAMSAPDWLRWDRCVGHTSDMLASCRCCCCCCGLCYLWRCSLSVFYSRSSSRASSGELSRQSWGSMRGLSLGHGPHNILGGSGGGAGMQSPCGSLGRVGAGVDMMAAAAAGKCSSLHSGTSTSRPRSGQRPICAATVPTVVSPSGVAPAASPAATAPVTTGQVAAGGIA
jgi:hypothetical protein